MQKYLVNALVCLLCLIMISIVGGCSFYKSQKQPSIDNNAIDEKKALKPSFLQAYLFDIPLPFDLQIIKAYTSVETTNGEQVVVEYAIKSDLETIGVFYQKRMQDYGWKELSTFVLANCEWIGVYKRPYKLCIIQFLCQQDLTDILRICINKKEHSI